MEKEIELKQYVIVPKKPKMSPGKIASQVAQATFMALRKQGFQSKVQKEWTDKGMCVIALQAQNQQQLFGIAEYLKQWKIPHHLNIDEGLTEVPMGTATALATGVLTSDKHWLLSHLKLYSKQKIITWRT